ncbi:MAG TPA: tRNA pseudouridine(55) synthase TruB [Solirubrobacteraceae bacterium]|nr:tRNA pseudouridine(55) synthase TruB [Solirubrobacteraceae bacterium]
MSERGRAHDGVLLVDKPAGMTSHDVVAAVRRALGGARTGHAGTLDPFATGLLLVLVGRATKAQSTLMGLRKRYETVAQLGARSSTGDTEGEITLTGRLPADPPALPVGEVRQRPPAHSAVKIRGERAYRRARRGEQLQMPERTVTVHRFEQLWREPDPRDAALQRAAYLIECGSGTYVRSLIADLHDAYCLALRRTAIGPFDVRDASPPPPRPRERPRAEAPGAVDPGAASRAADRGGASLAADPAAVDPRAASLAADPNAWPLIELERALELAREFAAATGERPGAPRQ